MGKKPAPAPKKPTPPLRKEKGGSAWTPLLLSVAFVLLMTVSLPSMVLLFIGMLPTLVAWIVDRNPQKYSTFCVGGMNFCGVFPYLLDLWGGTHSVSNAVGILTNVFTLLVMYGAAAFGWMMFMTVPPVVSGFLTVMQQRRVAQLRAQQKRLIEEWGDAVAHPEEA
jgi:hypothetical protein